MADKNVQLHKKNDTTEKWYPKTDTNVVILTEDSTYKFDALASTFEVPMFSGGDAGGVWNTRTQGFIFKCQNYRMR